MAISANQIVQVLPRVVTGTGSDLVFHGMVLDRNPVIPTATPISFVSAEDVGEYFGTESDEYKFASIYFGGFEGSQLKPSLLYFYKLCPAGAKPFVRGASLKPADALVAIKAISAGTITVKLNGTEYTATGIDLSATTSLDEAALTVQNALNAVMSAESGSTAAVTVTFSSITNTYTITSATAGVEQSIEKPSGDVADALGLSDEVAVVSAGAKVMTVIDTMNELTNKFTNFVTFTTLHEPDDQDAIMLAQWSTTQANAGTMFLYVCRDSAKGNLDANSTTIIAEQFEELEVTGTCTCYPDLAKAAFIMGAAASINWEQRNGTITFKFKSQSGLGADIQETKDAVALESHRVNYVGNFATRNDNFIFLSDGSMHGKWRWIDTYLNACWLCNKNQAQLMTMFTSNRRIPYTEKGYAIIRSNIRDVMNQAINNGVVEAGVQLSEAVKAQLISELGGDYSDEIYATGYYLQIVDATANIRQARTSPACNLVYTYGGAIHKLVLPSLALV